MKIISFRDMYQMDYHLKHLFAMNQRWDTRTFFNTGDTPRKTSAFLFCRHCAASYTFPGGETLYAEPGSLIYLPKGSRYRTDFQKLQTGEVHTQLLEFDLIDGDNQPFSAMEQVSVVDVSKYDIYHEIFDDLIELYSSPFFSPARMKAKVYELLYDISKREHYARIYSKTFQPIAKGILYLEQNISHELSIAEIAELCHVSESCFRRLFQQFSGMTPHEYKARNVLRRAKALLRSGDVTISEIAVQLGYEDASYFSRFFKQNTGLTPREYSRQFFQTDRISSLPARRE